MKGFLYSDQLPMFGHRDVIGYGTEDFLIKYIDKDLANKTIIDNHYSGKIYNATYIHLGVFINTKFVGVLQYGYAMNPASGGSVVEGTGMNNYLELNRMWLSDEAPRNSESKAISYSIKLIRKNYPKVKWIQSFADERCGGFGIVYQACSFRYYGEHKAIFWTVDGEIYHNSLMTRNPKLSKSAAYIQHHKERATKETLRQFRYIKFLDQSWRSKCLLKERKYLKHYNND